MIHRLFPVFEGQQVVDFHLRRDKGRDYRIIATSDGIDGQVEIPTAKPITGLMVALVTFQRNIEPNLHSAQQEFILEGAYDAKGRKLAHLSRDLKDARFTLRDCANAELYRLHMLRYSVAVRAIAVS